MEGNNLNIETWIQEALAVIENQSNPNIAAIGRQFDLPEQRLKAPSYDRLSLFEQAGLGQKP